MFPRSFSVQLSAGLHPGTPVHPAFRKLFCDDVWRLLGNSPLGHCCCFWNHQCGLGLWNRPVRKQRYQIAVYDNASYFTHTDNAYHCSFLDDIEVMLKWRPPVVYKYLWKYVCLLAMVGLLAASLLRMVFKGPTYTAWNQTAVRYYPL